MELRMGGNTIRLSQPKISIIILPSNYISLYNIKAIIFHSIYIDYSETK